MNDGKKKTETGNNPSDSVLFDDLFLRVRRSVKGHESTVSEVRRHFLGVGRTERERRGDVIDGKSDDFSVTPFSRNQFQPSFSHHRPIA